MPLSNADRERARYHMGYLQTSPAASIQLGLPRTTQTSFMVEQSFDLLMEVAVPRVLRILEIMDTIEEQEVSALKRLKATALGDLKLNENEEDQLKGQYREWGLKLSEILGAPVSPFSNRYRGGGRNRVRSIPVSS